MASLRRNPNFCHSFLVFNYFCLKNPTLNFKIFDPKHHTKLVAHTGPVVNSEILKF
jgi:hypothetical protein